ncbi:MAG: 30S ribosomal protein S6--L-glutamate ligase [Luteibaculum sp.]
MAKKRELKIGVLSRNPKLYSTQRLVEAIMKAGHRAVVIDHLRCSLVAEFNNPQVLYKGQNLDDIDAIIPRIGSSVTHYGSAVVRQFEMMGKIVVNPSISIVRSRDKLRSVQIFTKHNVPMPKTVFANHPRYIDTIIEQIGGAPMVIKLLSGTQGIGVVLAETRKAATSVLEAFYGLKADILIQEFIKEAGGSDIRAFVVDGKVVGAMKRQGAEGEFRSNLHRGGSAMPIKLTKLEREIAIKAAKAMGLNVAGVDMLQSSRGPLVLEVNSSPGLEGIEKATEKDVASSVIKYIEKQINSKPKTDKVGA